MNDAVVKAEEFAKAITDSAEYKRFKECSKAMEGDTESRRLMAQYQSKQRRLRLGRFEPNLMDEMRDLHLKISQNVTIQNFNESSIDLIKLLKLTDDLISEKIGRRFAVTRGGSCCG